MIVILYLYSDISTVLIKNRWSVIDIKKKEG